MGSRFPSLLSRRPSSKINALLSTSRTADVLPIRSYHVIRMPQFARYIGIDYSARRPQTPVAKGSAFTLPRAPASHGCVVGDDAFQTKAGDGHAAFAVAAWLQRADRNGSLGGYWNPPLTPEELEIARIEGWILGVV